jgi:hypothetical protein
MLKRRLLLLLLVSTSVLCAQHTPSIGNSVAQETKQSFTLSIGSPSLTWKSADPIRLDATVKNLTDQRLHLYSSESAWERGEIIVRDGSGNAVPPVQNPGLIKLSFTSIFVEPSKSLRESFNISRQFNLTKPGQYSLQIDKEDPTTKTVVKSNTLVLTVTH